MAQEGTEEDGEGVMECEVTSPTSKRILAEAQAAKVAKRLLGPPKARAGQYMSVYAERDVEVADVVILNAIGNVNKWTGEGIPSGIAMASIKEGNYGWIQTKS
jgi:hypothetical protein